MKYHKILWRENSISRSTLDRLRNSQYIKKLLDDKTFVIGNLIYTSRFTSIPDICCRIIDFDESGVTIEPCDGLKQYIDFDNSVARAVLIYCGDDRFSIKLDLYGNSPIIYDIPWKGGNITKHTMARLVKNKCIWKLLKTNSFFVDNLYQHPMSTNLSCSLGKVVSFNEYEVRLNVFPEITSVMDCSALTAILINIENRFFNIKISTKK